MKCELNYDTTTKEDTEIKSKRDCMGKKTTHFDICGHYEACDDFSGDNCAKQTKTGDSTAYYQRETIQHLDQLGDVPPPMYER